MILYNLAISPRAPNLPSTAPKLSQGTLNWAPIGYKLPQCLLALPSVRRLRRAFLEAPVTGFLGAPVAGFLGAPLAGFLGPTLTGGSTTESFLLSIEQAAVFAVKL